MPGSAATHAQSAGLESPRRPLAPLAIGIAVAVLLLHVVVNRITPYGFHRDEFLYLAMGRHLRLWAMDFPPFIAIAAKATLATLGGSLIAVRILPAVVAAILVLLAVLVVRRMGCGPYAQVLGALAVALAPLTLRAGNLFQPVIFDQLWWTLALVALMGIADLRPSDHDSARRRWLLLGVCLGLGLLTKFSIAFIGIGIVAAVLITASRRWLATPWPWLALLVALVIGSPSIVGQLRLGFPVVGQMHDLQAEQLQRISPLAFLQGQWDMLGPVVLLAALGVMELLRGRYRIVAWACLATFVLLIALKGKPYYVGPIYPVLLAAGAVAVGRIAGTRVHAASRALWRGIPLLGVVAFGVISFPFGVPVLPPARMDAYARALGITSETNTGEIIALPQDYADMLGWEDQVEATARVYHGLSPAEQQDAVILGTSYGRAGANDQLGPALGLPPAVSPVGSYWFFGPGTKPGKVLIVIGGTAAELQRFYDSVSLGAKVIGAWRVPEEREVNIWVARGPHQTLQEVWEKFRGQN